MLVTIHQPHYFPWLGYLERMLRADVFVLLDHVQFERGNYQNRTRILMDGEARWLTVPVAQHSQKERILDKEVDYRLEGPRAWGAVHFASLRHAYRLAPFAGEYLPALERLLKSCHWERLAELNAAALQFLREAFAIRTPLVRSSELGVQGVKSELILDICRALGADAFLGGMGGSRSYLDTEAFRRAGVRVQWQQFVSPQYPQCAPRPGTAVPFVAGLSSLDLLMNCGPRSRDLLTGWAGAGQDEPAAIA
jgi:hypothetical protein